MRADLEVILSHDGDYWMARMPGFECRGETLRDIDRQVTSIVRTSMNFKHKQKIKIFMGFDFDTIPVWLRQYHDHYFNRILTIQMT